MRTVGCRSVLVAICTSVCILTLGQGLTLHMDAAGDRVVGLEQAAELVWLQQAAELE